MATLRALSRQTPGLSSAAKFGGALLAVLLIYRYFDPLIRVCLVLYAAVIVAIAINTLVRRLPMGRRGVVAGIASALVSVLVLGIVFGGPLLLEQMRSVGQRGPEFEEQLLLLSNRVRELTGLNVGPLHERARTSMQRVFGNGDVILQAKGAFAFVLLPLLVVVGGLFAVASPNDRLLVPALRMVPRERRRQLRRAFDLLGHRVGTWIQAQIIAMAVVGTLATIALTLLGVPYALLLGVLNGFTEFIPLAGPWMGGVPAVAIATLEEPSKGVWTALAMFGIQFAEFNLITPFTMAKVAHVHPFITLFALFAFGSLFGLLGMLLALPLVLLIWTVVQVFWVEGAIDTDQDRIAPVVED